MSFACCRNTLQTYQKLSTERRTEVTMSQSASDLLNVCGQVGDTALTEGTPVCV
jgi:hypothetical protein